jgi:hypothetical protein
MLGNADALMIKAGEVSVNSGLGLNAKILTFRDECR